MFMKVHGRFLHFDISVEEKPQNVHLKLIFHKIGVESKEKQDFPLFVKTLTLRVCRVEIHCFTH